ncbi:equilibrative nucleotide transporter 2-like [Zingiber officinale]|uniref:equilibrative nucleotide transporter 2-like n=1 Tax=Zingiber officinale TaxID=94328 RepID=UPI001C4D4CFC|nr:equilibrative nucleotide transporter 2-like [Zingiber officinale]
MKLIDFGLSDFVKPGILQIFAKYHPTRVLTIVYQPFALVTIAIFTYHEAKVNTRLRNLTGYILFSYFRLKFSALKGSIQLDVATSGKGGIGVYIGICVISAAFGLSDALVEGGIVGDLSMMSPEFLQFKLLASNGESHISFDNFRMALLQNATESMKESKVIDILNVARHPFLLPFFLQLLSFFCMPPPLPLLQNLYAAVVNRIF